MSLVGFQFPVVFVRKQENAHVKATEQLQHCFSYMVWSSCSLSSPCQEAGLINLLKNIFIVDKCILKSVEVRHICQLLEPYTALRACKESGGMLFLRDFDK